MSTETKLWDKVAHKYAAKPIKNMEAYNQTMDRSKAYLSTEDEVLEVGCGTGSTALLLASSVAHITASDISATMIEIGQGKAREQRVENVEFVQAAIPDATLKNEFYDAILAFNTLHLVRDLPAVIRSLRGALKPGGMLISKTVCLAQQTRLWAMPLFVMRLLGFAPYVNLLTFDQLEGAITEASFEIVETGLYPGPSSRFIVAKKL